MKKNKEWVFEKFHSFLWKFSFILLHLKFVHFIVFC